jgi:hypothetical protein
MRTDACSFCGKDKGEVERMIAGPNVFICNECIQLCVEALDEPALMPEPTSTAQGEEISVRVPDGSVHTCVRESGWRRFVHRSELLE